MLRKLLLLTAIVYTLVLVITSLITLHGLPSLGYSFDDKIYHVAAYMILGLLWMLYFKFTEIKYSVLLVFFGAVLLGYLLELLQYLLNANRTYDTFDLIANTIGAFIGTIVAVKINIDKLK
ncbi:MAG: VanZ family protein [Winogradskyella sp.]|nr:VanZ family protein [Winogradskyella sp.]